MKQNPRLVTDFKGNASMLRFPATPAESKKQEKRKPLSGKIHIEPHGLMIFLVALIFLATYGRQLSNLKLQFDKTPCSVRNAQESRIELTLKMVSCVCYYNYPTNILLLGP
ncbi:hypothetical protein AMECASPLE_031312 [Ameca splendens]|uniref:Uncharacterized protein n=1 Tax=Ameca splendens TaxID=208324 RepID=A0ABV1A486_9TELE